MSTLLLYPVCCWRPYVAQTQWAQSQASDRVNTPGKKRCSIVLQLEQSDDRRPRHLVPSDSSVCGPLNSLLVITTGASGQDATLLWGFRWPVGREVSPLSAMVVAPSRLSTCVLEQIVLAGSVLGPHIGTPSCRLSVKASFW